MRNYLLPILFILYFFPLEFWSQSLIPIVQQSGKTYHQVVVHKGLTLTGIRSKFNITEEQLKKVNPNLTANLAIGQVVLIPAKKETFNHTVAQGETMYGICQRYQIAVDSLKASNKALVNSDIKIGQVLIIRHGIKRFTAFQPSESPKPTVVQAPVEVPAPKIVDVVDSSFSYVVKQGENLSILSQRFLVSAAALMRINNLEKYNVSEGTKLKIPVNFYEKKPWDGQDYKRINGVQERFYEEGYRRVPSPSIRKDSVKIAMVIPMDFKTFKHPVPKGRQKALYDFYFGLKMARDSLVKKGLKGNLFVYDCLTKGDEVSQLISKGKFTNTDMILLPNRVVGFDTLVQFSREKRIPLFCFFKLTEDEQFKSPYLYIIPTASSLVYEHMGYRLAGQSNSKDLLLVTSGKKDDVVKEQQFTEAFEKGGRKKLTTTTLSGIDAYITSGKPYYFISLTTDTNVVLPLIKKVNEQPNAVLIGTREWTDINQLSNPEIYPSSFYYWSTTCFDGSSKKLPMLKKNFKTANGYDLNKSVALGYDAMYLLSSWFFNLGTSYFNEGIMTQIEFIRYGENTVLNQAFSLCRFSKGQNTRNVTIE
jgi:LysM repeat protein